MFDLLFNFYTAFYLRSAVFTSGSLAFFFLSFPFLHICLLTPDGSFVAGSSCISSGCYSGLCCIFHLTIPDVLCVVSADSALTGHIFYDRCVGAHDLISVCGVFLHILAGEDFFREDCLILLAPISPFLCPSPISFKSNRAPKLYPKQGVIAIMSSGRATQGTSSVIPQEAEVKVTILTEGDLTWDGEHAG